MRVRNLLKEKEAQLEKKIRFVKTNHEPEDEPEDEDRQPEPTSHTGEKPYVLTENSNTQNVPDLPPRPPSPAKKAR